MDAQRAQRTRLFFYLAAGLYALAVVYALSRTPAPLAYSIARAAALLGYGTMFVTILSHEYLREMRKIFGKPFMTVHHILAVAGLVLITVHPILMVIIARDPSQFLPRFDSLRVFLTFGGRAALYLFLIAALAAVARRRFKDIWRPVHWLNYLAFVLDFAHSWLLGGNVSTSILKFISPLMLVTVVVVFVRKRLARKP